MGSRSRDPRRMHSLPRRLATWNAQIFRPRQIIVRSDDRVHALSLGTRLQQTLAGVAVAALLWSAGSATALYLQSGRIDGKQAELAQAERAYGELMAEVQRARSEVIGLAAGLPGPADAEATAARGAAQGAAALADASVSGPDAPGLPMAIGRLQAALDGLAERNGGLADKLTEVREELEGSQEERAALEAEHARVEATLAETRQALADARLNRGDLVERVGELRAELNTARTRRHASQQGRLGAEARVAELERQLETAQQRRSELGARVTQLEDRVERSEEARTALLEERRALSDKVGRLEEALGEGMPARGSLGERIADLERALLDAEERGDALARERTQLQQRVQQLEVRIAGLRSRQSGLVERASARTLYSLEAVEKTIAMTGLDVDDLVNRVHRVRGGVGGPFVLASLRPEDIPAEPAEVERLDRQMQRLVALQTALGAMPLSAPVDSFWISSNYGKRKDPYNGRWAMHEGVDLAATAGSPVFATAPGEVVSAGRRSGYGRQVVIDHGYGIRTRYAHLRSIRVEAGQQVDHRQTVGTLGSSGRSTGPHVHYEVLVEGEPMDPDKFLKAGKHVFKR